MFILYVIVLSSIVALIFARSSLTSSLTRVILAILLIHGYLTVYSTFTAVSGYPTTKKLPNKFEVVYARVVEDHDEKFIELWIKYELPYMEKVYSYFSMHFEMNNITRVFRLPYTRENHEFVLDATKKITRGGIVGIKLEEKDKKRNVSLSEGEKDFSVEYESRVITK